MRLTCFFVIGFAIANAVTMAAQPNAGPGAPIPKLDADGPTSFVTALAFSPDGQTLYAAGWDKIIRVWRRDAAGRFTLDGPATFRVPIGPGSAGKLNALAVSSDGRLLATGGSAAFRHGSTFDRPGLVVPALGAMDRSMREDQGTIYVFDTRTREVRQLRGHQGAIVALEFSREEPSLLASAADEWDEQSRQKRGGLRLWNVANSKELASTTRLPEPKTRPALAVLTSASRTDPPRLPRVAAAWGDERLWIWNADDGQLRTASDGRYNNTVVTIPRSGIVTGSAAGLKSWRVADSLSVQAQFEQAIARTIPRAMAVGSSAGNGTLDTLAVVSREPGTEQDRLYLVEPRSGRLWAQPIALWGGRGVQPAIAASSAGDIAVTGGRGAQIALYRAADLRQNTPAAHQILDSGGETVRVTAFARNGQHYGLVLSTTGKEQPGQLRARLSEADRIFDATATAFVADRRGWIIDVTDDAGWSARHESRPNGPTVISISQGGRRAGQIELGPRSALGDYALLAPREGQNRPLLAIAYFDFDTGQPVLALYDAARGERFREYLGHTARITSVAFSRDGRLLATAADDKTVCVWTLMDLDQVLGARGQLPAVKVEATPGGQPAGVMVAEAPASQRGLAAGDIVQGMVTDGRVESFDSPRAFYQALSLKRPGEEVALRRARGADVQDVTVVVGQGIDERKPLFTFFTHRTNRQRPQEWIGWSPLGPYESSGPPAERLLGWHFNTGRADDPVSFAFVNEYRARFATRGLMQKLLETGRPVLPPERVAEAPSMSLWLNQSGQAPVAIEPGTSLVIHAPPTGVEASTGPLSADEVESIAWSAGERSGDFDFADGQWRADLSGVAWQRGAQPVEFELRTKPPHRELKHVATLVYQPAPPKIQSGLRRRIETAREQFEFQADVEPAIAGIAFHARLTHQHGAEAAAVVEEVASAEPATLRKVVQLHSGINVLKVSAENDEAMAERAENEQSTAVFEVYYDPPKATPGPRIDLVELAIPAADGAEQTRKLESQDTVVVSTDRVVLRGSIQGSGELSLAQFQPGADSAKKSLDQFAANKAKDFKIEQPLALQPGENRFTFESKTATSELTSRRLTVVYRPLLPALELRPTPSRVFAERLTVVADLTPPPNPNPYKLDVFLNDRQLLPEQILADDERVQVLANLKPGDNHLEFRISNEWGTEPAIRTTAVQYVEPPQVVSLSSERQTAPDAARFQLEVASKRRPTAAVVHVNGQPRRVEFDIEDAQENQNWQMRIKPVLLEAGENRIRVAVKDELAESEAKELMINVEKRSEPAPQIVMLSAHDHPVLPEAPVPVQLVVRSQSPIQNLVIEGEGADGNPSVLHAATDLSANTRKNAQGLYEYVLDTSVKSASDPKRWRVEAVNRGGRRTIEIPAAVIIPPASLFVESVALKSQPNRELPLERNSRGQLVLKQELPEDKIVLSGYVLSSQTGQSRQVPVQVWANGFLQKPVLTEKKAEGLRRPFKAEVVLSQRRENLIEVGIVDPDLANDAANRTSMVLDCAKPNTDRRLHLVIIAVGAKQSEAPVVRKRAIEALRGRMKSAQEFTTPAFDHGLIHAVLLGNTVQRNKVLFEVGRLGRNLQPNDVAMIYYQGNVREANDTFYLTTSATRALARPEQTEISREELNRWTGIMTGAQLILLDVDRSAVAQQPAAAQEVVTARWPADSRIAFFRFAWAAPEPAKTPDEPVLLTAWEQAAQKPSTLEQIDSGLALFSAAATSRYPAKLMYEGYVPTMLRKLEFVPRPDDP